MERIRSWLDRHPDEALDLKRIAAGGWGGVFFAAVSGDAKFILAMLIVMTSLVIFKRALGYVVGSVASNTRR